jgi:peptidyl-prolyl cis-trans isomerase D
MYDFIHRHKRLLEIILLVLIVPPFALFGVDWYFRGSDSADQVAKVAGSRITQQEYTQALRQYQDRLRQMSGGKVDQAMLDSPEIRRSVLDQLIDERVSYTAALKSGLTVPVNELQSVIADLPDFKDANGKFSPEQYKAILRNNGRSDAEFEAMLRKNLIMTRSRDLFAGTAFLPNAVVDQLYKLRKQQREVSQVVFEPGQFTAQTKIADADVKAYYDAHKQEFQVPEKVKLQYVMLNMESAMAQVTVSPDDVKAEYEKRIKQQQSTEERRASHILVAVPASATPEVKQKAKEKAEGLLKQAQAAPKSFAELAKKNSEDPGSAVEGGDLGFTPRGRMVKPFEDAMFGMKVGDIVGPIETQFGYHIIKLTDVKAAQVPTLESLKPQIEQDIKKTAAQKIFAKQVEDFSNLVYDQPDSLKPVIEKFKLTPQTTGWVSRQGGDMPLLANEKLMRSIFSESVLRKHQNTEAVEVAPNIIVAARVTEHEDAKERPLDDVKPQIVELLTQQKAAETAQKQGQATLEKLRKGEDAGLKWSAAQMVTRESREGLSPDAAQAVFSADPAKLPGFVGVEAPGGRYVVYRVSKVVDVPSVDPEQRKQLAKQLEPLAGQESYAVRIQSLRQNADVKVDDKKIADKGSSS